MKLLWGNEHVCMAEADAGGGDGAGTTDAGNAGAAGGGAGEQDATGGADQQAGDTSTGSVLSTAAGAIHERFAEKFRTFKEDQSFDLEGTAIKQAEAYSNLEKRFGNYEAPPKTIGEYTFQGLPEGVDAAEIAGDPVTQKFLETAHKLGMGNAAMNELFSFAMKEWAPALLEGNTAVSIEECNTELRKVFGTEESFKAETGAAYRASQAFATEGEGPGSFERLEQKFGNDPDFIAFCANVGREMKEDSSPNAGQTSTGQSLDEMMASEAYTNPKHKDHERVSNAVRQQYQRKYGSALAM